MMKPSRVRVCAAGIAMLMSGGRAPGLAQAPGVSVIIDAAAPLAPMSTYIYGQLLVHPGRCIYGGVWAEMLTDRKFFHPLAEGESPWSILGEPRSTAMTTSKAFVGAHSPEFELDGASGPSGLSQAGLGVVAGARYTGRVVLAGGSEAGPIEVSLVWGAGPSGRQTVTIPTFDERYRPFPIAFTAGASTDEARLEIAGRGKGRFRIGTASLMPANNVEGFRADVLALLRELDAPVYRWPGGPFAGGYDWRDGVGERDRRPPRKNPAWKAVEHNDVRIHEFMALCRLVGAEPYIGVNSGPDDAASAAAQVEYVNGAANTPMGAQRALNGSQAPFNVRWWPVGNEMYGEWTFRYTPHLCGTLGTRYVLEDALGVAAGIHEHLRQADTVFTANNAQTENVIGAITTSKTAAAFETTGLVLKLYRAHFGQVPVAVTGAPGPLDVAAAWREDRSALTLAIVNPTADAHVMALQLKGAAFGPTARLRRIAGTDPKAFNEPGKPPAVSIAETAKVPLGDSLTLPPLSVSIYELRTKQ
jgi:alpha-L-arabinofuranosidase